MQNIYPAMKAIIVDGKRFLVIKQVFGDKIYWDIPGGKVDHGEDPYDTLLREVKEEVGLDVEILKPAGVWWFVRNKDGAQVVCTTYTCKIKSGDIKIGSSPNGEDIREYCWVTKEEFLSKDYNVGHESLKKLISKTKLN